MECLPLALNVGCKVHIQETLNKVVYGLMAILNVHIQCMTESLTSAIVSDVIVLV